MNRIKAVQRALDGRQRRIYLEIGVSKGEAFRHIAAEEKIAVDPEFALSARTRKRAAAKASTTHYFETSSDAFFANETLFLEQRGIDVAFIDGLHTYRQVIRDVENTLRYLRDDGVILVHDCNPTSASMACPAESYAEFRARHRWRDISWGLTKSGVYAALWCGDVWKAIVELRSTREDLRIVVLNCDFGVGVIRRGTPDLLLDYSAAQIEALGYADLAADRNRLLNLRPPGCLDEFLESNR
ncbi:class I SAM-dependent methyltransferase [Mycobacterium sp. E1747]|uniref:class I SAM-dependent methyltransferase n=1 Tax=Mycobacterium sp. E1747 TaxID=1834128 RepID=UPI0007FD0712|nr:class I SAM-dependent methyltransferase [Mycobacterium sp. E1747]OBH08914.1 biotin carboxyl carrier protein [Mycobacterium sp. E1747]